MTNKYGGFWLRHRGPWGAFITLEYYMTILRGILETGLREGTRTPKRKMLKFF